MSIETRCKKCNKGYRVGDDKAGMRFRCKQCGAPVSIPQSEPELEDFGDDWGDGGDDWGGTSPYGGGGSPYGQRSSSSSSKGKSGSKKKSSKKKSGGNATVIVASIVGVVLVAGLAVGGVFLFKGGDDDKKDAEKVADNNANNNANNNGANGNQVAQNNNQNNNGFNPNNNPGFNPNNPPGNNPLNNPALANVEMPANMPNIPRANLPPLNGVQSRYIPGDAMGLVVAHPGRVMNSPLAGAIPPQVMQMMTQDGMGPELFEQFVISLALPAEMKQMMQLMLGARIPLESDNLSDADFERLYQATTQPVAFQPQGPFGGPTPSMDPAQAAKMALESITTYMRFSKNIDVPATFIAGLVQGTGGADNTTVISSKVTVTTVQGKTCFSIEQVAEVGTGFNNGQMTKARINIRYLLYMPNQREAVIASQANMNKILGATQPGPLARRADGLSSQRDITLVATLDGQNDIRNMLTAATRNIQGPMAAFASLPRDLNSLSLEVDLSGPNLLMVGLEGVDDPAGARLNQLAMGLKGMAALGYAGAKQAVPPARKNDPNVQQLLRMGDQLVAGITVSKSGRISTLSAPQPKGMVDLIKQMVPSGGPGLGGQTRPNPKFPDPGNDPARNLDQKTRLKQIGLAFHNFHDTHQGFSPAVNTQWTDGQGTPHLSWRVHLLPFLEQQQAFDNFDLTQSWSNLGNKRAGSQMPGIFRTAGVTDSGKTSLHVFTGPGTLFEPGKPARLRDITDGSSNTILAVVAGPETAVNWYDPLGLPFDPEDPKTTLGTIPEDGILVLMCDGSVRTLPADIDKETLKALITPNGGETVNSPR